MLSCFRRRSTFGLEHARTARTIVPGIEILEDRCTPATFTVTNLDDAGAGSLRQAVLDANATPAVADVITFQAGLSGTITLTSGELLITDILDIQGPGAATITVSGNNASQVFEIQVGGAAVNISGLTLTGGSGGNGGAICNDDGNLTLTRMVITGNRAFGDGGGICNGIGDVTVESSTVSNNFAGGDGGGLASSFGTITFRNSIVSGNSSEQDGGGLYQDTGTFNILNTTISGNISDRSGGGFYSNSGIAQIENSTFFNNSANFSGGAIGADDTTINIINTTISGNRADFNGGGINIVTSSTLTIQNSTIVNNIAGFDTTGDGGGIYQIAGTVILQSSIVANNFEDATTPNDIRRVIGGTLTVGNSLIRVNPGAAITTDQGGNIFGQDPLLGPLQNNGGPTFTHALLANSPALNTGSNPAGLATDQRGPGFLRDFNGVDIGAFEAQPVATTTTLTSSLNPSFFGQPVTFTATVTSLGGTPTGTVNFLDGGTLLGTVTVVNGVATLTTTTLTVGIHPITAAFTPNSINFAASTSAVLNQVVGTPAPPIAPFFLTGADAGGGPQVNVYNLDGSLRTSFFPLPYFPTNFTGGIRVAQGDVSGDGVTDFILAAGPGGGPQVVVVDGATSTPLISFFAFSPSFSGGVFVAAGDVNGDGTVDVVTGADTGGGPQVSVFNGRTGALLLSFFAFDASFSGGARVAVGDVDGDGRADIIVSAGPGGGPQISVFDGRTGIAFLSFYAFPASFTGGVYVAAGNVTGDARLEIIAGAGAGGGPQVTIFNDAGTPLSSFFALPASFSGGVRVSVADRNGDGRLDILASAGPGGGPEVSAFDGTTLQALGAFFAYPQSFSGGVFVG